MAGLLAEAGLLSNVVVFTGRVGGPGLFLSCLPGCGDKAESGDEG